MKNIHYLIAWTLIAGLLAGCKPDEPAKAKPTQEWSTIQNNEKSVPLKPSFSPASASAANGEKK